MNLPQNHKRGNVHCLSHPNETIDDSNRETFTRRVYQVDATTICQLTKRNDNRCTFKSFGQVLYLASIERLERKNNHQNDAVLLMNAPDLIAVAVHWDSSRCTTSDVEDFVSIIEPFIFLRELFYDVAVSDARTKRLNLIGLVCFYGNNLEVFFSYEHSTSKWLFCFDGHVTVVNDWNAVIRKCIDFHLQPFLLIYANAQQAPVDISQLLKRTVIQTKIVSSMKRIESTKYSMSTKQEYSQVNPTEIKHDVHSLESLSKISSFATLNSSMLFMPKLTTTTTTTTTTALPSPPPPSSYINQETVAKVMQQQLLKKEALSDTVSSPMANIRQTLQFKQKFDDTLSSGDSSASSQRDSGLSSGINDGSSDDSQRDSLPDNEHRETPSLAKQTEQLIDDQHVDMSLASIEHYLEQSLKYESASNYSSALDSCQQALLLVDQMINLNRNSNLTIYARTRRNSLLLRMRSLRKRQIQLEESESDVKLTFKSVENIDKKSDTTKTSILSSAKRLIRPKKNVKFSDNVALIIPTPEDLQEPPSEHLIHEFLRQIQQQQQDTSDSDPDTPLSSSTDIPIGLVECSLCYKRFSKCNQVGSYCSNCHFYMQRFRPMRS